MKEKRILTVLGQVDEKYIAEAAPAKKKDKQRSWVKWVAVAACLCLVVGGTILVNNYPEYHAEDPNWDKTHIVANSPTEAVDYFGDDLLLQEFAIDGTCEYILEYKENGSVDNRETWRTLVANSKHAMSQSALTIFFDENNINIAGTDEIVGYDTLLGDSPKSKEIGNTIITFNDNPANFGQEYKYVFCAKFEYNGAIYFLEAYSNEDAEYGYKIIEAMLNSR